MNLSDALKIPDARKIIAECLPLTDVMAMSQVSKATRLVFMSPPHALPVNSINHNNSNPLPFGESFKCFDLQVNVPSTTINAICVRGRWGDQGWGYKRGVFFIVKEDRKNAEDDGEGSGDIVCVCPINEEHECIHLEFRPFEFGPGETYSLWAKIDSEGGGYKLDARDFTMCYLLYTDEDMKASEISEPGQHDILCGKGNRAQYHPGNIYFRDLIKNYKFEYATTTKQRKTHFRTLIYDEIKRKKGRFLKQNLVTKRWSEIFEKEAFMKIGQALREGAPEIKMAFFNKQQLKLQQQGLGRDAQLFDTHNEDEAGIGIRHLYSDTADNADQLGILTKQMAETDEKKDMMMLKRQEGKLSNSDHTVQKGIDAKNRRKRKYPVRVTTEMDS